MKEQKWAELADYYDLAGTNIDRGELVSGRFFVRTDPPQAAHPGGFWKYRQPFPPGFAFDHAEPSSDDSATVNVTVAINIDQGGGAVQRGVQTFQLRKSDKGYQLLPRR